MAYSRHGFRDTGNFPIPPFSEEGSVPSGLSFRRYAPDSPRDRRVSTIDVGLGRPLPQVHTHRAGPCVCDFEHLSACPDYLHGDRAFLAACDMLAFVNVAYWYTLKRHAFVHGLQDMISKQEELFVCLLGKDSTTKEYLALENMGHTYLTLPQGNFKLEPQSSVFFNSSDLYFRQFVTEAIQNIGHYVPRIRAVFHMGSQRVSTSTLARMALGRGRIAEAVRMYPTNLTMEIVLKGEHVSDDLAKFCLLGNSDSFYSLADFPKSYLDCVFRSVAVAPSPPGCLCPLTKDFFQYEFNGMEYWDAKEMDDTKWEAKALQLQQGSDRLWCIDTCPRGPAPPRFYSPWQRFAVRCEYDRPPFKDPLCQPRGQGSSTAHSGPDSDEEVEWAGYHDDFHGEEEYEAAQYAMRRKHYTMLHG